MSHIKSQNTKPEVLVRRFLFANAYLERGKTHRHGYASLYRGDDGNVYFKLNLQVRLK